SNVSGNAELGENGPLFLAAPDHRAAQPGSAGDDLLRPDLALGGDDAHGPHAHLISQYYPFVDRAVRLHNRVFAADAAPQAGSAAHPHPGPEQGMLEAGPGIHLTEGAQHAVGAHLRPGADAAAPAKVEGAFQAGGGTEPPPLFNVNAPRLGVGQLYAHLPVQPVLLGLAVDFQIPPTGPVAPGYVAKQGSTPAEQLGE